MLNLARTIVRKCNFLVERGVSMYKCADNLSFDYIRNQLASLPGGGKIWLELDEDSGIGTLCIDHPNKKNSITGKMMVDLESVVSELERWDAGKGLLVCGAGGFFSSGGDFTSALGLHNGEIDGYHMAKFMQHNLERLHRLPIISVAFIQGFALGGAAEIAMFCDFRLFAPSASLCFGHVRHDLAPAWGGLTACIRATGHYSTALRLVAAATPLSATDAEHIGLCDQVVEDVAAAKRWLSTLLIADTCVLRAAKSVAANTANAADIDRAFELESRAIAPLWPAHIRLLASRFK